MISNLEPAVIASSQTTSNVVSGFDDAAGVSVSAPASLTGTISVQIEPTLDGSDWCDLTSGGTDVTVGAGNSLTISPVVFRRLRLVSTMSEASDRTFRIAKRVRAL